MNKIASLWFIVQLLQAPISKRSRDIVFKKLSSRQTLYVLHEELKRQADELDESMDSLLSRLSSFGHSKPLQIDHLWRVCRSLVNLNMDYLGSTEKAPLEKWDCLLSDGEVRPVNVLGMDCLKFCGVKPVYARIASVVGYGEEYTPEGVWGRGDGNGSNAIVMEKGNYIICNRFMPFTRFARSAFVKTKQDELHRQSLSIKDLVDGKGDEGGFQAHVNSNSHLKTMLEELLDIQNADDRYGLFQSHVVLFEEDPKVLKKSCRAMNQSLQQTDLRVVWEGAGLLDTFLSLLPAYHKSSLRSMEFNTAQTAACSMTYRSTEGQPQWMMGDKEEEALYVFESDDGTPFHYTPYVGEKCLVIGVGPTRSGKSFFKNVTASHYMKFGGLYSAIDVDPGTEPLAKFYKDDGGIFTLDKGASGFNPFSMATGTDDLLFISHLMTQIRGMLQFNENESLRELTGAEQRELDEAIQSTLGLPKPEMRTLKTLSRHCSKTLQTKLSRWVRGGVYGKIFDNDIDGVGVLNKKVSVYNLSQVKDNKELASLVNNEIYFRVTRLFEHPDYRLIPKYLDIDECQYLLSIPGAAEFLEKKARTWFKHHGGVGLWTQSPKHYSSVEGWQTLRSSASTFIFMADPKMDKQQYKDTFLLTDGVVDTIANLKPKQQALIFQPELDIYKVVNLHAAPEEYAIATSKAHEAVVVQTCLNQFDNVDEAIAAAVEQLHLNP